MKSFLLSVFFIAALSCLAQQELRINLSNSCSHDGQPFDIKIYGWDASPEAIAIVHQICDVVGIKPNFDVKSGSVPNAIAIMQQGGMRQIIYSENFMLKISNNTGSDWAAKGIFAHEIGHHLHNHPLEEGESRPEIELEADEFSGFILARMGATLDQAQSAVQSASLNGNNSHPPRRARLEAIAQGWKRAIENNGVKDGANKPGKDNNRQSGNSGTYQKSRVNDKYVDVSQHVEVAMLESENGDLASVVPAIETKMMSEGVKISNTWFRQTFTRDFGSDIKKLDMVKLREIGLTDQLNCICQITSRPVTFQQSARGYWVARGKLEIHLLNLATGRVETNSISASGAGVSDPAALSSLIEHLLDKLNMQSINLQQCK